MKQCVVGIGSNIEAEKHFKSLQRLLPQRFKKAVFSKIIKTSPIGYASQADFSNGAVLLEVEGSLTQTEKELKRIEEELGRVRTANRNGPRTMDLDILVWDGVIVDENVKKWPFWPGLIAEVFPLFKLK